MKRLAAAGFSLLAVACGQNRETQTQMQVRMAQEAATVKAAIAPIAQGYQRWFSAGQADSVAAVFTEGGRQMPPNEPAAVGRDAIRARNGKFFAAFDTKLTVTPEAVVANGPLAVERGTYQLDANPRQGAPKGTPAIHDAGKYLQHWELVNGQWMIVEQAWNSDKPMGMPAPATGKAAAKKPAGKTQGKTSRKK